MRRRVFRIIPIHRVVICLILGLITTIAVAWGCALWSPLERRGTGSMDELPPHVDAPIPPEWRARPPETRGDPRFLDYEQAGFGIEVTSYGAVYTSIDYRHLLAPQYFIIIHRSGWPWKSKRCEVFFGANWHLRSQDTIGDLRSGIETPLSFYPRTYNIYYWNLRYPRPMPLGPIWSGLIGNTLLWGSLWFFIPVVPSFIRRRFRHRRGLCMNCAYDLRGTAHERCPECGGIIQRPEVVQRG